MGAGYYAEWRKSETGLYHIVRPIPICHYQKIVFRDRFQQRFLG